VSIEDELDDVEIEHSPLCRTVTEGDFSINILIYKDGNYGWILEVEDEYGCSTLWDEPFFTDQAALDEAMKTIEEDGVSSFIRPPDELLH
jgi:uncharacterized protein